MKTHTEDEKLQGEEGARFGSGKQRFKKNTTISTRAMSQTQQGKKGVGFSIGPHRPEMYQKTVQKVSLYTSMQFKNGLDVTICLLEKKLVKPEVTVLEDEHTAHE